MFFGKENREISFPENYRVKLLDATENILSRIIKPRKPNFKVDWISPRKLVGLTHYHSKITQVDIQGVFVKTEKILESIDEEFSLIIDNRLIPMDKLYSLTELQNLSAYLKHELLKYIIVIIPNHLNASVKDYEIQRANGVILKNVSNVSEAFEFLFKSKFISEDTVIDKAFLN